MSDTMESVCVGFKLGYSISPLAKLFEQLKNHDMWNNDRENPVTDLSKLPVLSLDAFLKKYPSLNFDHPFVAYCIRNECDEFTIDEKYRSYSEFLREVINLMRDVYCKIEHDDLKCSMLCFFSTIYDYVCQMFDRRVKVMEKVEKNMPNDEVLNEFWNGLRDMNDLDEYTFSCYLEKHSPNFSMPFDRHTFHKAYLIIKGFLVWGRFYPVELGAENAYRVMFVTKMKEAYIEKYYSEDNFWFTPYSKLNTFLDPIPLISEIHN